MVFEMRQDDDESRTSRKKEHKPLMDRLNVPLEHLDYKYAEDCKDGNELEKILRILRSGEEGIYPQFQDFVEKRLEKIKPQSRQLRIETPALKLDSLEESERQRIEDELKDWLGQCETASKNGEDTSGIFVGGGDTWDEGQTQGQRLCPIRGSSGETVNIEIKKSAQPGSSKQQDDDGFLKPRNPNRIKSWDYDKWDKFNAEAELTKMEIEEMRLAETQNQNDKKVEVAEKYKVKVESKPKANWNSEEQRNKVSNSDSASVSKMKYSDEKPCCSRSIRRPTQSFGNRSSAAGQFNRRSSSGNSNPFAPSFIEEIQEDEEHLVQVVVPNKQKQLIQEIQSKSVQESERQEGRRCRIIIDDLCVG